MVTEQPGLRLLHTKLLIPGAHPVIVERANLDRKLAAGLNSRLVLVTAPAGYGKTTLLSKHFKDTRRPTAWVSLDERDNEPIRFWSYFIAALQTLYASQGKTAWAMLISSQPPPIENILTSLINDIASLNDDFTLCLDDYHVITNSGINEGMVFLIENLPEQMHLVIAGRSKPPFPLPILRTRRHMLEIDASDLRFTYNEVTQFLNQLMDLNLSVDQIKKIDQATEGWAAGLQLAALSIQGSEDISKQLQSFSGDHRFIFDYLAQEVLYTQSTEVQEFLLKTSILDQLNGKLCDSLLDMGSESEASKTSSAQAILDHLERSNLFIFPLDPQRQWYRYHHLFSDFLKAQLTTGFEALEIKKLHSKASDWFYRNDMMIAAIDHAIKSGDYSHAASLIDEEVAEIFSRSELPALTSWLEEFPPEIFNSQPKLDVIAAWAYLSTGNSDQVVSHLKNAEDVLGVEADGSPKSMRQPPETRGALAEITCIRTSLSINQFDLSEALRLTNLTQQYLTEDVGSGLFNDKRDILAVSHFNQGIVYDLTGEITQASESFSKTIALNEENLHLIPMAISHLAHLQELQGLLHKAEETYLEAKRITDQHPYPLPLSGLADIGLGNILCERNLLDKSEAQLRNGVELGHKWSLSGVLTSGYIGLARAAMAKGNNEKANQLLAEAIEIVSNLQVAWQIPIIESYQALVWARQGEIGSAEKWSQNCGIDTDQPIPFNQETIAVPLARVWIAMNRHDEARDLLGKLIEANDVRQAWGQVIQLRIFESLAAYSQGDLESASFSIKKALQLAEQEDYQRIFLDEGETMQAILHQTDKRLGGDDVEGIKPYIGRLLLAFQKEPYFSQQEDLPSTPLLEQLSEREIEVFKLLEEGLSNQEIAARLYISMNTVKAHLKSIYGKLGVNNRVQAISKGRNYGL
jgi:LuxR family maltose regulon positive regulatory protein